MIKLSKVMPSLELVVNLNSVVNSSLLTSFTLLTIILKSSHKNKNSVSLRQTKWASTSVNPP